MELTNISMPVAALLASLIGATATISAALLQLRIAWRKELQARAEKKPITKKAKRGPITAVMVLMLASSIGGFALAHYLASSERARAVQLEETLNKRIEQLDNVSQFGRAALLQQLRLEEALRQGQEGVATQLASGRCIVASDDAGSAGDCSEQQSHQLRLCVELPAAVSVTGVELFAHSDAAPKPWSESRVMAGSDFGKGRFSETHTERLLDESHKQVCQGLGYWNSQSGVEARMVVHYLPEQSDSVGSMSPAQTTH